VVTNAPVIAAGNVQTSACMIVALLAPMATSARRNVGRLVCHVACLVIGSVSITNAPGFAMRSATAHHVKSLAAKHFHLVAIHVAGFVGSLVLRALSVNLRLRTQSP